MARSATVYSCAACGHESPKWHGRCPGCGEWNSLVEEARPAPSARARRRQRRRRRSAGRALSRSPSRAVQAPAVERLSTGIGELDRVLGGGLVPGSLVLIGGSPGIGKSTLTSGALGNLAAAGHKVLYVSGEESAAQVKLRAERLGGHALSVPIVAETDLDAVLATLEAERPEVCVIDSVQVLYDSALTGAPGSVGPGARGRRPHHAGGQGAGHRHAAGRPRDQGGLAGGAARAGAPGRLRALVRGRARAHLPHAARAQEPLRLHQRGGRLRDGRAGAGRGRGRLGALREPRPPARPARWCCAPWRARARCWSRSRRWSLPASWCRRAAWRTGWTATAWRWCWRCWPATAASASARATCSCRWPAACAWTSPGADLAIALALASAAKGIELGGRQAARRLRRAGPDRRAAPRRARRPPDGGGGQVRPRRRGSPRRWRVARCERRWRPDGPQSRAHSPKTAAQSQNKRMSRAFRVELGRCRMPGMT